MSATRELPIVSLARPKAVTLISPSEPQARSCNIQVSVEDGIVTLKGTVRSMAEKQQAEKENLPRPGA
ncbi:MAG: BON domain-containing protein [Acidobacteria bacterium]|nr:BON domain-containing protein [Acidobacteriota bacterium]